LIVITKTIASDAKIFIVNYFIEPRIWFMNHGPRNQSPIPVLVEVCWFLFSTADDRAEQKQTREYAQRYTDSDSYENS